MNVGNQSIELGGVQLVEVERDSFGQGVEFTFGTQTLGPRERIVVPRDLSAFQSRYGTAARIGIGQPNDDGDERSTRTMGRLSNNGEQITLVDAAGVPIQQFAYGISPSWHLRANGNGSSLEVVNPQGDYNDAANWQPSVDIGGSPGRANSPSSPITFNEVLANSGQPQGDLVEFRNNSTNDVNLAGWHLSNSASDYLLSQLSGPATISAGGFLVLSETELGFSLDARGGEIWLTESDANGRPVRFASHLEYGVSDQGVSLGPDSTAEGPWIPLAGPTFRQRKRRAASW